MEKPKLDIIICTVATGKYNIFLIPLLKSIDKFFLKDHNIYAIIFTDNLSSSKERFQLVRHQKYIDHLPIPLNTLLKFKYITTLKEYKNIDMIFYIDGDCEIVSPIKEECFPDKETQIVVTEHPWQGYDANIAYETNKQSMAYVDDSKKLHYFQASFFGGYKDTILSMADIINSQVELDLRSNIIAKCFDESHFNKYIIDNIPNHKALDCGYCYPDPLIWNQKFDVTPKIIHKNYNSVLSSSAINS